MPKDIANLRLVSRRFQQLPGRLFKHLIKRNMPWFWEMDELEDRDETFQATFCATNFYKPGRREDVSWLRIYEHLRRLQKSILGVRNRVRVWNLVEEIVARIERLQIEDPSGKYHIEGKDRLEWAGVLARNLPPEQNPANVTYGRDCPRCTRYRVSVNWPCGMQWDR
jgi:hypothetical protein